MSSPCQIATAASPNCQQWMTTSNYVPPIVSCVECFKGVVHQLLQWLQASPWACSFANMSASVSIYSYSLYHLYLTVSPSTSLSLSLSPSLSVSLSACRIYLSAHRSIDPSIHPLFMNPSIHSTYISVCDIYRFTTVYRCILQGDGNFHIIFWDPKRIQYDGVEVKKCGQNPRLFSTENPPWAQLRL